jgi:hypothetical protein
LPSLKAGLSPEGEGRFSISLHTAEARDAMRGEMVARVEEIGSAMQPIGERGAMREVVGLLSVMALRNASETEASALMAVYAADLAELPPFALAEACRAYRRGTLGDGKWAPTPGEIYQAALSFMAGPIKERNEIRSILLAKVEQPKISPERRAELAAEMRRVADSLRAPLPSMDEMRGMI